MGEALIKAVMVLRNLALRKVVGPSPSFTEFHLSKALEVIGERGPIGRAKLSEELKMGEGATRTLINHLQKAELIKATKWGCLLTRKGRAIIEELESKLLMKANVPRSSIAVEAHNLGILVKDAGHKIRSGIEQRDAAIKAGASSATTTIFRNDKLSVPPVNQRVSRDWMDAAAQILQIFNPEENDVIIICGDDTEENAEKGVMAAAWTLIE